MNKKIKKIKSESFEEKVKRELAMLIKESIRRYCLGLPDHRRLDFKKK